MKNHLLILADGETDQRKQMYIEEMQSRLKEFEKYADTGNTFIDILFHEKKSMTDESGIAFTYEIESLNNICASDMELCTIFANLLDNAIEACDKVRDSSDRWINVVVKKAASYYVLTIKNSYNKRDSEKKNERFHGYGLKNVKEVVDKYNGSFEIEKCEDFFSVYIMIPERSRNDQLYCQEINSLC